MEESYCEVWNSPGSLEYVNYGTSLSQKYFLDFANCLNFRHEYHPALWLGGNSSLHLLSHRSFGAKKDYFCKAVPKICIIHRQETHQRVSYCTWVMMSWTAVTRRALHPAFFGEFKDSCSFFPSVSTYVDQLVFSSCWLGGWK